MGKTVPDRPPAARAPAVLDRRPALDAELAALNSQIGETVLLAYEDLPGAEVKAAELDVQIRAVKFKIEHNAAAHAFAVKADKQATKDWWAQIHAMDPAKAVEGVTKKDCCRRCDGDFGCVITGVECAHPIKVGKISPRYQDRPAVRALYRAATKTLGVYR
jgi:hypothetical protein